MNLLDELRALGVDVDDGLKRIMGNEKLYIKLLGSFVKMIKAQEVDPEFDAANCTEVIEKVHAVKGTAGNLSLTPIFTAYSEMLGLLRGGQPEEAREILRKVLPAQNAIVACIEKNMNQ